MQFHRPVKLKLVTVRRAKFGRVKRCVPLLQVGHFFVTDGYAIGPTSSGSKPFPGRKRSIAPRFGYQQLTGLLALRVAPKVRGSGLADKMQESAVLL